MNYLLTVAAFEEGAADRPVALAEAVAAGVAEGHAAFARKQASLGEYADRLLALVMLNVIDEKWKEHLYDLDQLRSAIHYRSWGQKDPLVEYKQEAYTMFVELMHDLQHTFTERFLKVQLIFEQAPPPPAPQLEAPARRFDAMGVAEPATAGAPAAAAPASGPPESAAPARAAAPAPTVVGAGRPRSLAGGVAGTVSGALPAGVDLSKVGRNDVCPCGSGKKFKKCHGAMV